MNARVRDTLIRAAKTFVQVFAVTFAAGVAGVNDVTALWALAIAAATAGVSAVWNSVTRPALPSEPTEDDGLVTDPDV